VDPEAVLVYEALRLPPGKFPLKKGYEKELHRVLNNIASGFPQFALDVQVLIRWRGLFGTSPTTQKVLGAIPELNTDGKPTTTQNISRRMKRLCNMLHAPHWNEGLREYVDWKK